MYFLHSCSISNSTLSIFLNPLWGRILRMNFRIRPLINVMAWLGFELLYLLAIPKCAQSKFQGEMILLLPHSEAQFCFFSNRLKVCMCLLQDLPHSVLQCELKNPFTSAVLILVYPAWDRSLVLKQFWNKWKFMLLATFHRQGKFCRIRSFVTCLCTPCALILHSNQMGRWCPYILAEWIINTLNLDLGGSPSVPLEECANTWSP